MTLLCEDQCRRQSHKHNFSNTDFCRGACKQALPWLPGSPSPQSAIAQLFQQPQPTGTHPSRPPDSLSVTLQLPNNCSCVFLPAQPGMAQLHLLPPCFPLAPHFCAHGCLPATHTHMDSKRRLNHKFESRLSYQLMTVTLG